MENADLSCVDFDLQLGILETAKRLGFIDEDIAVLKAITGNVDAHPIGIYASKITAGNSDIAKVQCIKAILHDETSLPLIDRATKAKAIVAHYNAGTVMLAEHVMVQAVVNSGDIDQLYKSITDVHQKTKDYKQVTDRSMPKVVLNKLTAVHIGLLAIVSSIALFAPNNAGLKGRLAIGAAGIIPLGFAAYYQSSANSIRESEQNLLHANEQFQQDVIESVKGMDHSLR